MPTSWQLECLHARFRSLEVEITRVQSKYHPYLEPDTIYTALLSVLHDRHAFLKTACRLFEHKPHLLDIEYEGSVREVKAIFDTLNVADRVDSSRIPFELLGALSWAAGDLLKEECTTVVHLFTEYNYAIVSCRQWFIDKKWEYHWAKITRPTSTSPLFTVLVLEFPSPAVGSTLLHAIAAHELGHVVLGRFSSAFISIQSALLERARERHQELLQEFILDNVHKREGVPHNDAYEESGKLLDAILLSVSKDWLTEIWADLMAARLVGPASLAAFDRVALEPGEPCETHPPGYLRRRLIKKYLDEHFPHIASQETWSSVLTPWPRSKPTTYTALTPLFPVLEWLCVESLPLFVPLLQDIPSPLTVDVANIVADMEKYIEHLCPPSNALPDALADESSAVWLLMYAVWHFRFNIPRYDAFRRSLGNPDTAEAILGNLLLHALHSVELKARWRRWQITHRGAAPS
jgi:hypothetical protein